MPHTSESRRSLHYRPDPDSPDYPAWEDAVVATAKDMAERQRNRKVK